MLNNSPAPREMETTPRTPESVLKSIVDAASGVQGRAALSHYPSRRLWAVRLHDELTNCLDTLKRLREAVTLARQENLERSAPEHSESESLFGAIFPILLRHHVELLQNLLSASPPLPIYQVGDAGIEKTFADFNRLLSACRQYVDTAIQDAYQLSELNATEFNYAVLSSLSSFLALAPASLVVPFLTEDLVKAVEEFKVNRQQKFATSKVRRFHEVAKRLVAQLNPTFDSEPQDYLERVFRFSSDFAHVGFASSLATFTRSGEVYMGSQDGVFFATTENYAELQFMVLKSCLFIFADVYLRAARKSVSALFPGEVAEKGVAIIDTCIAKAKTTYERTGRQMHAWVSNDAMLRKTDIWFRCPCETWFVWRDPYFRFDLYCPSCGAVFHIARMREPFSYCVLPEGPCDVFGADGSRIDNLSESVRNELYRIWKEFSEFCKTIPKTEFVPVLMVGDVEQFKMRLPGRNSQKLYTFISNKAIQSGDGIPIVCNCTFMSLWIPKRASGVVDRMTCWACGSSIRLLALEGDAGYVIGRVDDKTTLFDVQASTVVPSSRLSEAERNKIIRELEEKRGEEGSNS